MHWIGKAVGGILGFAVAGPVGSIVGLIVGHRFDDGLAHGTFGVDPDTARVQQAFFQTTFEVMGHLAKVDGRVSEQEIRVARGIMHGMRLSPEAVQEAIRHFTNGKRANFPLQQRLSELRARIGGRRDLVRAFVEIQLQAAVGAGRIDDAKRRLLLDLAQGLGIDRASLAQMEANVRGRTEHAASGRAPAMTLKSAYSVLGVHGQESDQDIKTAYRRLMSRHHPDKLVSRGLPESMIAVAERKTHEIRAAYEVIKSHRSFK